MYNLLVYTNPSIYKTSVSEFSKFSMQGCLSLSKSIGLWPSNLCVSPIEKFIKFTINCLCCLIVGFGFISNFLDAFIAVRDLEERIIIIGPLSFTLTTIIKYMLLIYRSQKIEKCVKSVYEDWQKIESADHREVMIKNSKFGYYLTLISAIFMYSGGFWYSGLRPLMAQKIVTAANITIKPYPFPVYGSIIKNGYSPIYEIVFASHIFIQFVECTIAITCFSIAAVLTMHACGQLEIVTLYLNDLVNGDTQKGKSLQSRLNITVNHHLKALRFIESLEDLLCQICLVEVFGSVLCICLLGYYINTAWNEYKNMTLVMTYTTLLSSVVFNIFIYCFLGELLTTQAAKVGECTYMINWYLLPKKIRLDMSLLIQISHSPAQISAGKIIFLSMGTFNTVIRSSAAYLNMLWRLT